MVGMGYRFVVFANRGGQVRCSRYAPEYARGAEACWEHAVGLVREARGRRRDSCSFFYDEDTMVVYRVFGALYVLVGVGREENLLAVHEVIQALIEALDAVVGGGVCELDLIRHLDRVHFVVDAFLEGPTLSKHRLLDEFAFLDHAESLME